MLFFLKLLVGYMLGRLRWRAYQTRDGREQTLNLTTVSWVGGWGAPYRRRTRLLGLLGR
jgi:hypothetical protein